MIKCNNLSYAYQPKTPFVQKVFSNVTIEITGKKVLILGFSGSGKSTFFKMLTGYLKVKKQLLMKPETIFLVMQNVYAQVVTDTVYEEINLGYEQKYGVSVPETEVEALIDYFQVDFNVQTNPQQLSGGQKKILMIICAIIINPDLIIFDEPFVGLDLKRSQLLIDFLKETTIPFLISSHKPEPFQNMCDQVVIINEQNIYHGTISEAQALQILKP